MWTITLFLLCCILIIGMVRIVYGLFRWPWIEEDDDDGLLMCRNALYRVACFMFRCFESSRRASEVAPLIQSATIERPSHVNPVTQWV